MDRADRQCRVAHFAWLAALALPAAACAQAPTLRASEPSSPASPQVIPLDSGSLEALPRQGVTADVGGRACEGVPLSALLHAQGALPETPSAARYVLAEARDGRRALFSLSELDPRIGSVAAYVVDRCDGSPLHDDEGPLRLHVAGDALPVRDLHALQSITVITAP